MSTPNGSDHAVFYWCQAVLRGRLGNKTASWPWSDFNGGRCFTTVQQMSFGMLWAVQQGALTFEILEGKDKMAQKNIDDRAVALKADKQRHRDSQG